MQRKAFKEIDYFEVVFFLKQRRKYTISFAMIFNIQAFQPTLGEKPGNQFFIVQCNVTDVSRMQQQILHAAFDEHMQDEEQRDDVTLVGLKLKRF